MFAVLGFLIPLIEMFSYGVLGSRSSIALKLWFTSGITTSLDAPHANASVLYSNLAGAWIANILIYAAIGALVGFVVSSMRGGSRSGKSR